MKQKDIAQIILVAAVAAIAALILSKSLFKGPATGQSVEVAPVVTSTFTQPNTAYFNSSSIDPTQLIQIGSNRNNAPFGNGSGQGQ